ncbi:hypothetical protein, partial [Geobacillus stearothermophilus]|uniref:hypothetical protein n=1 Tax=Geobacillus stearothermophilus TaxID=1422 RepID=UPI003D20792F
LRSEGVRSSHILSYSLANANRNSSPTFTGAGAPSRLEVGDFFRREVKAKHRQHDRQSRENHRPRCLGQEVFGIRQHFLNIFAYYCNCWIVNK